MSSKNRNIFVFFNFLLVVDVTSPHARRLYTPWVGLAANSSRPETVQKSTHFSTLKYIKKKQKNI
jgi:hypothetical protein